MERGLSSAHLTMVAYDCHHLSYNYVNLLELYVVLSDHYVELSDLYVEFSLIDFFYNIKTCFCPVNIKQITTKLSDKSIDIISDKSILK